MNVLDTDFYFWGINNDEKKKMIYDNLKEESDKVKFKKKKTT